ncbi:MAG: MBL fold metallo-hydrolase [Patescibacteria group bacterium]|jgi:metallo-beta-lactamase family protein
MKLTFFGAAGEVTGSCSLLETGEHKILIDCGMFQGGEGNEQKNQNPLPFSPAALTAVLVTHAHLDHVGRLPLLTKNGFKGFIYATPPTRDLARLIMEDAYGVMEYDHRKFGRPLLYEMRDVENVMAQFKTVDYYKPLQISRGKNLLHQVKKIIKKNKPAEDPNSVTVTFHDAGHVFGSAFIEIESEGKRAVFSGDVGNVSVPILRDTDLLPKNIDVLICESTYGDRTHESSDRRKELLEEAIKKTISQGGVLMIPSFALERTQELLYTLNDLIDRHHDLKRVPIFLDSPLAIDALKVFEKYPEYYDEEADKFYNDGDDLFNFPGLVLTYTRDESMKINHTPSPKIIIAGAGMMNGGRILHHAMRYLSDHRNTLLIIGYQAHGTLGWQLLNGHTHVQIHGESIPVHCEVKMLNAFSAHGDRNKLIKWIENNRNSVKKVVLNHGDPDQTSAFAKSLNELKIDAVAAEFNKTMEI